LPFKFTGKEYDPETGWYYFGARYYDARLSRWTAVDPALDKYFPNPNDFDTEHDYFWYLFQDASNKLPGIGGVFNTINLDLYHYAGQNPVKLVDPDGECTFQIGITIEASAGGSGTASIGLVVGFSLESGFQMGTYGTAGFGGMGDVGGSIALEIGASNNTNILDLSGSSITAGGSLDAGAVAIGSGLMVSPTAGIDVSRPNDGRFKNNYSMKLGLSSSINPVEMHGYLSKTVVSDWKVKEKASNLITSIVSEAKSLWGRLWK
jgi:hypothetical protein